MVGQKMNGLMIAGVLGVLGVMMPTVVGCSNPQVTEEKGSTSSKLLAPNPLLKAKSSPASNAAFGITEWRLYRGKNDLLLTGYDAKGAAVKGVSVGFHSADSSSLLRARFMDGSLFAAKHDYSSSQTSTNQTVMADETSSFLGHALSDFKKLHAFNKAKTATTATTAAKAAATANTQSLHSLTLGDDGSGIGSGIGSANSSGGISGTCGVDMMAILNSALQCVQNGSSSSSTSSSSSSSSGAVGTGSSSYQACLDAATAAASAGSSCLGSTGDGGCFDATADGGDSCYGDDDSDDDGDSCSGGGGGGSGWGSGGPGGDWGNNPFGDGACPSCSGGGAGLGGFGSDISGDSGNGGCSFSDSGGSGGGSWGDGY